MNSAGVRSAETRYCIDERSLTGARFAEIARCLRLALQNLQTDENRQIFYLFGQSTS